VRTSEDAVPAKFAVDPYGEYKRCMLVSSKPGADFSRGCAHPATPPRISTTHPPPIRESSPANASHSKRERGRRYAVCPVRSVRL
jgi:hypothetical protein